MRCQACDKNLNDWESTKKNNLTGEYEDLCAKCLNVVQQTASSEYTIDYEDSEDALDHVQERPSDFDYYESDWDEYD